MIPTVASTLRSNNKSINHSDHSKKRAATQPHVSFFLLSPDLQIEFQPLVSTLFPVVCSRRTGANCSGSIQAKTILFPLLNHLLLSIALEKDAWQ